MRIGLDLDEVLGSFLQTFLQFYNELHNTTWKYEDFNSYNFWDVIGGTKEDMIKLLDAFITTAYFEDIPPIGDALHAVEHLGKEHDLIVITSRPSTVEEQTNVWLDKHFPQAFDAVHVTNQFSQLGPWRSKADVCKEENIDVLVEDNLAYAQECAKQGVHVYLIDAPWNQTEQLPTRITRVTSWREILEELAE